MRTQKCCDGKIKTNHPIKHNLIIVDNEHDNNIAANQKTKNWLSI